MIDGSSFLLFLLAVLALFVSPGPNMAFVLSHGVAMGPRAGFAAGLGIAAADLVHTVCAASGVTALVAAWPPAFDLLRHAGALYLLSLAGLLFNTLLGACSGQVGRWLQKRGAAGFQRGLLAAMMAGLALRLLLL